jgi:hypothetical protein
MIFLIVLIFLSKEINKAYLYFRWGGRPKNYKG